MNPPTSLYTAEFKELTVKRIKEAQTCVAAAKDLQVVEKTLRNGPCTSSCAMASRSRLCVKFCRHLPRELI